MDPESLSIERFFLLTAFFAGLVLVFIIPPFQSPDENNHFYRAYQVSEGQLMGESLNGNRLGGDLPASLYQFDLKFRPIRYHYDEKTNLRTFLQEHKRKLNSEERIFVDFPNTAYYAPFAYLPQALGIFLGRQFGLSPIKLLYLGRIFGLFTWIWLVWLGLKFLPFWKRTFVLLALLPASLSLHSSLSADIVTNGICFFLLGYFLHFIAGEVNKFTFKNFILIFLLTAIVALNKVVYFPIILLLFTIPKERFAFESSKMKVAIGGLAGIIFLLVAWFFFLKGTFISYDNYDAVWRDDVQLNPGVDPMGQIDFIIQNPIQFFRIVIDSHISYFQASTAHYFGKFGWEKNYLPVLILILLAIQTNFSAARELVPPLKNKKLLIFALFIAGFAMMALFTTIMYMQWSPVGNPEIFNLGGRYYFSIFPLFFLVFSLISPLKKAALSIYFFFPVTIISLMSLFWEVLNRYYY
jgi:uncharacterized membrane protein